MRVATSEPYTTEGILATLGYPNPMEAARQQARMILLGRIARYRAIVRQFESQWGCTLEELHSRYQTEGHEDIAADDAYLEWQWYAEAAETVSVQLTALAQA